MTWQASDRWSYSDLLGLYLGDGCVSCTGRTYQLRIVLDGIYPGIIDECEAAVLFTLAPRAVYKRSARNSRAVIVEASSKLLPEIFPQYGVGRKHERPIVLTDWQREIVDEHPKRFLRGLINSDGCRVYNVFTTRLPSGRAAVYRYPRYFFSNLSADIRGLFCEY